MPKFLEGLVRFTVQSPREAEEARLARKNDARVRLDIATSDCTYYERVCSTGFTRVTGLPGGAVPEEDAKALVQSKSEQAQAEYALDQITKRVTSLPRHAVLFGKISIPCGSVPLPSQKTV